ncbi:glycosyltransferase family 4 protein [Pontibacter locisalis]|uniref:Glycosyltransferase family 4 protein n=1 Tax=Pontibacter locisalis TaxID=1719035 RepID=A0ABW5IPS3_9BACT
MKQERIAIISTHPIQYNAPLFNLLASQPILDVKVFYTLGTSYADLKDRGFGKKIEWDVPLLDGYNYKFLKNSSIKPGTAHFNGVINPDIIDEIDAFTPTAILVYGWSFSSHLKVLRYYKGKVPVFFRGDSTLFKDKTGIRKFFRKLFLTWVYSFVDKAFYVGTNNKQYYLRYGVKEKELIFAPHAIDNERFSKDILFMSESKSIRRNLGIKESDIVFAFIGKFETVKNPLLLLDAFRKLKEDNLCLLFVGNGPLEEELKSGATGISNIYFLPFQNQKIIPAIYRVADVFVLPSLSETWGLAVNEAMACGLPVVVSDNVGCAVDLVQEGKNGYIFKSGNVLSLTGKLEKCIDKPKSELKQMGIVSRSIVNRWTYEKTCNAILETLVE